METLRIGLCGDAVTLATSYGKTSQKLLRCLAAQGHEVFNFALQHAGEPVEWNGIRIFQSYDGATLSKAIAVAKPDIVVHLRDLWVYLPKYFRNPYHLWPVCKSAGVVLGNYSPVQSWPLPQEYIDALWDEGDFTITMTRIGMQKLIEQGGPADRLHYLYHGADPDCFHYMEERPPRSSFGLPDYGHHLITFVGLNQDHRKMIPLAIMAFKTYKEKYDPDAVLYLHTDASGHYDIPQHVKVQGLGGKHNVFMRPAAGVASSMWGFTDVQMGQLYNMSDALISMTTAEGFNMPALEALVCGTPAVLTDTPVHRELFGDLGAYFVPSRKIYPNAYTLEWLADPDAAAELLHEAVQRGRRPVELPAHFRWEQIAKRLEEILEMRL